jgi:hypothetical protein
VNTLRYILSPKLFIASLGILVAGVLGFGLLHNPAQAALPEDCDGNSIIYCGFQSAAGFQSDYNANVTKDLPAVYKQFGFTADEMSRFQSTYKWAWSYRDGRIVLDDGRVVATSAWSIGRQPRSDPRRLPYTIQGASGPFYWSPLEVGFAPATTRIRTLVMMDTNDKYMEFAVMTSCGNPENGTKPVFQCDMLKSEQTSDNTFSFWTEATAEKGATIKNIRYDFGDGTFTNTTNKATKVSRTYAKPGTYHVKVTITYTVNGVDQTETVQAKCQTDVTVKEKPAPIFSCSSLQGKLIEGNRKYSFTATGHYENGAKLVSASFDFGDGSKAENQTNLVKVDDNNSTITVPHTYATSLTGKVHITADLKFNIGEDTQNKKCETDIELKTRTCADTPTAPECQPPKTCKELGTCREILPSTGPEDVLLSAAGIGSFAGAGMYYRATRRQWINNIFKR